MPQDPEVVLLGPVKENVRQERRAGLTNVHARAPGVHRQVTKTLLEGTVVALG
jgi:hypothetical protein